MKIRMGFVSNSSSSSFCIPYADLTCKELYRLVNAHKFISDRWDIEQTPKGVAGYTTMDNGELDDYVGIDTSKYYTDTPWDD